MHQNIFDDDRFLREYLKLRRNPIGHNELIEKPCVVSLLGDLRGLSVLDVGCGYGDLCQTALQAGATNIVGVDISAKMINLAKQRTELRQVTWKHSDVIECEFPPNSFDVVISSLTLHYLENLGSAFQRISRWLRPRGRFVFSTEHPIATACPNAWVYDDAGIRKAWQLSGYGNEGLRVVDWLVPGVQKFHRMTETIFRLLGEQGFAVDALREPIPSPATLALNPALAYELTRPPYLVIAASRMQAANPGIQ